MVVILSSLSSSGDIVGLGMSFYKILGLKRNATLDEVRDAYKANALRLHPDKPGGDAVKFRELQKAYETLRDTNSRREYDQEMHDKMKAKGLGYRRPAPLSTVKKVFQFNLLDGSIYDFEISPEQFHCKFRHGDLVKGPDGDVGILIGLASNGVYWRKQDDNFASLLYCPGFGGDHGVKLLHRDVEREQHERREILVRRQSERSLLHLRQCSVALQRLREEEKKKRLAIYTAVDLFFQEFHSNVRAWQEAIPPRLSRVRSSTPLIRRPAMRLSTQVSDVPLTPRRAPGTPTSSCCYSPTIAVVAAQPATSASPGGSVPRLNIEALCTPLATDSHVRSYPLFRCHSARLVRRSEASPTASCLGREK